MRRLGAQMVMGSGLVARLLKDRAVSWFGKQGSNSKSSGSTIQKVVMAIVVVAFVAYLSYTSNRLAKNLAKARHERDVAKEKHLRAVKEWELASIDEDLEKITEEVGNTERDLGVLEGKLHTEEGEHKFATTKIKAISNWRDMDSYLASITTG